MHTSADSWTTEECNKANFAFQVVSRKKKTTDSWSDSKLEQQIEWNFCFLLQSALTFPTSPCIQIHPQPFIYVLHLIYFNLAYTLFGICLFKFFGFED